MQPYDQEFFKKQEQGSFTSAEDIVPTILNLAQPQSVIDIGCGNGAWLSAFAKCGIRDFRGVDGDYVDPQMLLIPKDAFSSYDLSRPYHAERTYDLALSLEVAEHLPLASAEIFVDSLVRLAPVIVFSAAIPFQHGTHHVNEQFQTFWAERFEARGLLTVDFIRGKIWNNPRVMWWYAQNMLMYVRPEVLESRPLIKQAYERTHRQQLSIIHPEAYVMHADPRHIDLCRLGLKRTLGQLPGLCWNSLSGRVARRLKGRG